MIIIFSKVIISLQTTVLHEIRDNITCLKGVYGKYSKFCYLGGRIRLIFGLSQIQVVIVHLSLECTNHVENKANYQFFASALSPISTLAHCKSGN